MLTAKAQEAEKVMGLELGRRRLRHEAVQSRASCARASRRLRRDGGRAAEVFRSAIPKWTSRAAKCGAAPARGSQRARVQAARRPSFGPWPRAQAREQLLDAAWGRDVSLNDRVVDNHIVGLRRKLEPDPARPDFLLNIRGMGYRFDA